MAPSRTKEPKEPKEPRVSPRIGGKQVSMPNNPAPTERNDTPTDDSRPLDPNPVVVEHNRPDATPGPSGSTLPNPDTSVGGSARTSLTEIEDALAESDDDAQDTSRRDKGKGRALSDGTGPMSTQLMDPRLITMLDDLQLNVAAHASQLETASVVAEEARLSVQAATVARAQIDHIIRAIMQQYGPPREYEPRVIKREEEDIDLSQIPLATAPVSIVVTPPSVSDGVAPGTPPGLGDRTPEEGRRNLEKHRARMADMIQKTTHVGKTAHSAVDDKANTTERDRVRLQTKQFERELDKSNDRRILRRLC
ncbi:hypothetical protein FA95DRAFT_1614389 [Auriscalpium vulgare]|uniref:Uncharacterized protein n=1 Tax=Auriscalpium vulgare TaxID=40419 RepID=A0ACB8QZZ4_9AGAM|nr:hypothetical protein FA95DRAFT_1614389 [Auriscalpium vulgare]